MPFFTGKDKDTTLTNKMNAKFNLSRYKKGFSITSINETVVQFTAKVLSSKHLGKMRSNECIAGIIDVLEYYAVGI